MWKRHVKGIHFTLFSFLQIQDIEVVFVVALLVFLSEISKFSSKKSFQLKTV